MNNKDLYDLCALNLVEEKAYDKKIKIFIAQKKAKLTNRIIQANKEEKK